MQATGRTHRIRRPGSLTSAGHAPWQYNLYLYVLYKYNLRNPVQTFLRQIQTKGTPQTCLLLDLAQSLLRQIQTIMLWVAFSPKLACTATCSTQDMNTTGHEHRSQTCTGDISADAGTQGPSIVPLDTNRSFPSSRPPSPADTRSHYNTTITRVPCGIRRRRAGRIGSHAARAAMPAPAGRLRVLPALPRIQDLHFSVQDCGIRISGVGFRLPPLSWLLSLGDGASGMAFRV